MTHELTTNLDIGECYNRLNQTIHQDWKFLVVHEGTELP
jgi:hypothetical protein